MRHRRSLDKPAVVNGVDAAVHVEVCRRRRLLQVAYEHGPVGRPRHGDDTAEQLRVLDLPHHLTVHVRRVVTLHVTGT